MMVTVLEELLAGHLAVVGLGVGGHLRLLHVRHRQRVLNIRILSQCHIFRKRFSDSDPCVLVGQESGLCKGSLPVFSQLG